MSCKFTVVIPARFASSRLPGKPLAMINDKPMIQHVYERAKSSQAYQVIIATDDQRVQQAAMSFGAEVCLTAENHPSGTDRIQEVAMKYALTEEDIVVNVQGDEPLIPPEVIEQVAYNLDKNQGFAAATLSEKLIDSHEVNNPNIVKVVADISGSALYFSRAPIPFDRDNKGGFVAQRHIGIYAYKVGLLKQFVQWPMAPLESTECLEQLRILYNGQKIHIEESCVAVPGGVDTPEDLSAVRQLLT